jgi:phosphate-selective porin OprO/OprP
MISALPLGSPVWAQESVVDRIDKLEHEIAELKQQMQTQEQAQKQQEADMLAARQEQEEKERRAEKAAAKSPKVDMGKDGLKVTSAVGNYSLRVRGYIQADSRWFLHGDDSLGIDTFAIRRARPIFEGTAGNFGFRLMPDFGGPSPALFDAYAEYLPTPLFNLRAGKFKPPISLDRLRSATDLTFVERVYPRSSHPTATLGDGFCTRCRG